MRRPLLIASAIVLLAGGAVALKVLAQPSSPLDTQLKKVSYSIGLNLGKSLAAQEVETDFDALSRGIRDGLAGTQALDDKQIQETMEAFQKEMQAKASRAAQQNQTDGAKFQSENEKRPGVKKTASGLQYEILEAGDGPKPSATDRVRVHYRGTLIDGKEFDSSYSRGEPAVFPANRVIPGWTEALQMMPVGSKWKLVIPPSLGYGEQGAGGAIPPNSTLIFEVELLGIEE